MKFVVGRKYKCRGGDELVLVEDDQTEVPYRFDDGSWRFPDGTIWRDRESSEDIISQVGTSEDSFSLVKAARRVVELHDKGALSSTVGDSIAIEALRKALEDDNG